MRARQPHSHLFRTARGASRTWVLRIWASVPAGAVEHRPVGAVVAGARGATGRSGGGWRGGTGTRVGGDRSLGVEGEALDGEALGVRRTLASVAAWASRDGSPGGWVGDVVDSDNRASLGTASASTCASIGASTGASTGALVVSGAA